MLNQVRVPVGRQSCYVIDYAGSFLVSAAPEAVWSILEDLEYFDRNSPWLRSLTIDTPGLRTGSVLHGTISTPLPSGIRLRIALNQVSRPYLIVATVHGDLQGEARLSLLPDGQWTRAEVRWTVEIVQRPMRAMARVAHPVLRRGHDTVVRAAMRALTVRAEVNGNPGDAREFA
jgi:carbon monoxide dehydrogenase subunit G